MSDDNLIKDFEAVVGKENVMTSETDRHSYSYDAAVLDSVMPALVVRPGDSEALGKCVKLCNDNGLPLTVRGAGTNLSGGTIPHPGGVVVLTNGLSRILEINEEDMYAVVEPGVVTAKFAAEVAKRGLFYPPDPGSQAVSTLGGNVAENAGGLRGLKYGVTKDYVMGVDFWDVNGELIRSGSRTVKCVSGYNLSGLMVASEGTLGVFDKIILKLIPPAQAAKSMMAIFPSMKAASETVAAIIASKIVPATLEMMDNFTIRTVENFRGAGLPTDAAALLLIEVDGHPAQVEDEAVVVERICKENGATELKVAKDARRARRRVAGPPRRVARPCQAQAHLRAGGRHRAAFQDSGHDRGPGRHRQEARPDHRHLRPRGRRQSAPHHPDRQARQGRVGARGKGHRHDLRARPGPGRHPVRGARHRPGQVQVSGGRDLAGHPEVRSPHEVRARPQGHPQSRQDHRVGGCHG